MVLSIINVCLTELPKEDLEHDLSILEEVLRMLLEIVNAAFTHQLGCNPHLIYSVLHKREVLDTLRRQPAFQDVVANLDMVIFLFYKRLIAIIVYLLCYCRSQTILITK